MGNMDARLNAFRTDLADIRLKGKVAATHFSDPVVQQVVVAVADLRRAPRPDSPLDTQLLMGEMVDVFEEAEGWCWVQAHGDGYVGYMADTALSVRTSEPTHIVAVPRTFVYPGPDMKLPTEAALSMGSKISVKGEAETRGATYLLLCGGGAVVAKHVRLIGQVFNDPVSVAEQFLQTPYLWGGRSGHGIDCSGLVQLSYAMCGVSLQRDTAMQRNTAGREFHPGSDGSVLQRGDLVFWKAHVAMMLDERTIIHASGHAMAVVTENFQEALDRIGYMYGEPVAYRRVIG